MNDQENSFVDTTNSLEDLVQDAIEEIENKQNEDKKGLVKKSVDWAKRKYGDFLIYNGELLIAEGVASVAGVGAGEMLSNHFESNWLIMGGTMLADSAGCFGTYGFMAYLERRKDSEVKDFAKHMSKFGLAYAISGILSFTIRAVLTYHLNKEGYSGGEAALLAKIPSTGVYIALMNIIGYKLGIVGGKEENK